MTYAEHRRIIDVDSHLFELDDFLHNAARPEHVDLVPSMHEQKGLPVPQKGLDRGRELLARRQTDPATMTKFEASLMDNTKSGWSRLGAFDPKERSHTLDLLGFEEQWVLPTYSFHQMLHVATDEALTATSVSLNKAMADFCASDSRLKAIGYIPLNLGPEVAKTIMDQGFSDGCYSFMVPTNEPNSKNRSYTHPDFDPIWAEFADRRIPAVLHVAANGDYNAVSPSFKNNGKSELELGGDAPIGELGLLNIGTSAQLFLSAMIFDEVFSRHPNLRMLSMEHAATWIPSWLQQMDFTAHLLKLRRAFTELPSETAKRHIKVSPFADEPVGWIIDNIGPDMLVFASDYPHPEGTRDPIAKFERNMPNCDQATMDKFYHGNVLELMNVM
ncbi:MAG: amidohydrolase family protein [Pseudomonadales bacterium]|nr:amidohydrolase family protein [Pseudomonadales bacterium]